MKVLMINASPHANGNTAIALNEVAATLKAESIEVETIHIGQLAVRGCIACNRCKQTGKCAFDDIVNEVAPKFEAADALVVGTPVYYASANATLVAFLDRLFYSTKFSKAMKVGAGVVVARRGGLSATFDEINKYFAISSMVIATSRYWNSVHGCTQGEATQDIEGLQTMRTLGKNIAFLLKSITLGKAQYGIPQYETPTPTNFVR